jgi:hypothetical protein
VKSENVDVFSAKALQGIPGTDCVGPGSVIKILVGGKKELIFVDLQIRTYFCALFDSTNFSQP